MHKYRLPIVTLAAALLLAASSFTAAQQRGSSAQAVVELFTSQACSSCPPAEVLLGELIIRRPGVVALEFHVDYWNNLTHGSAGSWRDPFSSESFSRRQRSYDHKGMQGRRGVYTPQVIVNGGHALVGSDRDALYRQLKPGYRLPLDVTLRRDGGSIRVHIRGSHPQPADVWRVDFLETATTPIRGGENHGRTLRNHHVVTDMSRIGKWWGRAPEIGFDPESGGSGNCAVLVQAASGTIIGAAYCPS